MVRLVKELPCCMQTCNGKGSSPVTVPWQHSSGAAATVARVNSAFYPSGAGEMSTSMLGKVVGFAMSCAIGLMPRIGVILSLCIADMYIIGYA